MNAEVSTFREGTLLLTSRSFTVHCGRCGKAWSIPTDGDAFEEQRVHVLRWFDEHKHLNEDAP